MARLRDPLARPLAGHWEMVMTAAGACAGPDDLAGLDGWLPAAVPGTAAGALRAAGRWSDVAPTPLHGGDVWYRLCFEGRGREVLRFEGLATVAEVWLNGVRLLGSRSMFLEAQVEVELIGENRLAIVFRSLSEELNRPHKRGRWRPRLATPGSLRHVRTSLLGFMPGWCPSIDAVGPYRPVTRRPLDGRTPRLVSADLRARLDGDTGRLSANLHVTGASGPVRLRCDGRDVVLDKIAPDQFEGVLDLVGVELWWPYTHGRPRLHPVEAVIGDASLDLGRVGFRTLALTRSFEEGLSLSVNGVPVFCRGAAWTPTDLVGLPTDPDSYRPSLTLAREAGMNMLRVSGITLYEADAFYALCDELGILIWQDLMLANFDYPEDDPAFRELLVREIEGFLDRTQTSPSLCVIGGGSEVFQQAAMLGFPRAVWEGRFVVETLPGLVARTRPDLIVVPNSPSGGDMPFYTDAGVTHYYGVGAYRRPLEDARRAAPRFASECLAFANVPEAATLRATGLGPNGPGWAAGVPRDRGADWDFETVRDHYVASLFRVDPAALRGSDPDRYLTLGRAAVAEVMEAAFAEWRRAGSVTAGGLVWFLRDLSPGAGWGVIDASGRPKSAWYALKRAFRPVQVMLTDEGVNGLQLHVRNESAAARRLQLRLAFTDAQGRTVAAAACPVEVEAHAVRSLSSAALLGRFFDATDAYRFGAPAHALGHARLCDEGGTLLAEAFHFPQGRDAAPRAIGLAAELVDEGNGPILRVKTRLHALSVHVDAENGARASDNWFHLAPDGERCLSLVGGDGPPRGTVRAVNTNEVIRFGQTDA